ncbi:MAG: hypothetical protein CBD87_006565 [Rhizobiales bacterium TMED227]|nr:MAG: hypothetical protein CBD87_006565 [Rhizobiales bacterium TMED227]
MAISFIEYLTRRCVSCELIHSTET